MRPHRFSSPLLCSCIALGAAALSTPASAQWSSDPAINLAVSSDPSDQSQSKLAPTADGGTWVSWFDGGASGWDVRIQRLDVAGVKTLGSSGVLVADRNFSSTQDYGLDVSSTDDALMVFRDDRPGGTQITAAKITASGTRAWGGSGVVLTSTTSFVASPKIAGTSDGGAVVAWTENADVKVQKLDSSGLPVWGSGVTLSAAAGSYSVADLQCDGNSAILSLVNATGGFSSPRHLYAQKFDANGAPLWGSTPLAVFDGGSLQIGNFPAFITDGVGGGIFSWYSSSPALQCFAQRVDASGAELWAHNGVALATTAGNIRVNPNVAFDAATGDVYATWGELNGLQSQRGIGAQRLNAAGVRLWTDAGTILVPLSTADAGLAAVVADSANGGALFSWAEAPSFGTDQLYGAHVNASGSIDVPRFDVASTPSNKSRLQAATSAAGFALLSWKDQRNDGGDIYAQSVRFDGTLGGQTSIGTSYCTAVPNSTGAAAELSALGSASLAHNDVTLNATGLPANAFGFFLASRDAGFVMGPGGSQGNLCLGGSIGRYVGPGQIQNSASQGAFSLAIDLLVIPQPTGSVSAVVGETWRFQAWHRDLVGGASTSNFTDGRAITFN